MGVADGEKAFETYFMYTFKVWACITQNSSLRSLSWPLPTCTECLGSVAGFQLWWFMAKPKASLSPTASFMPLQSKPGPRQWHGARSRLLSPWPTASSWLPCHCGTLNKNAHSLEQQDISFTVYIVVFVDFQQGELSTVIWRHLFSFQNWVKVRAGSNFWSEVSQPCWTASWQRSGGWEPRHRADLLGRQDVN